MGKTLSADLRKRIVQGISAGKSRRAVAEQFEVAPSTAVRLQARFEAIGSVEPSRQGRPPGGGKNPHLPSDIAVNLFPSLSAKTIAPHQFSPVIGRSILPSAFRAVIQDGTGCVTPAKATIRSNGPSLIVTSVAPFPCLTVMFGRSLSAAVAISDNTSSVSVASTAPSSPASSARIAV